MVRPRSSHGFEQPNAEESLRETLDNNRAVEWCRTQLFQTRIDDKNGLSSTSVFIITWPYRGMHVRTNEVKHFSSDNKRRNMVRHIVLYGTLRADFDYFKLEMCTREV